LERFLPSLGKFARVFFNVWKTDARFFQPLDRILPVLGKSSANFSRVRKGRPDFFQSPEGNPPTLGTLPAPAGRGGPPRCGVLSKTHRLTGTMESALFAVHFVLCRLAVGKPAYAFGVQNVSHSWFPP
jgi:hypothetical protein